MTHIDKFSHKFGTTIKHTFLWKWVRSKPSFLGNICKLCILYIGYLCHLEPAFGRINHCGAPQFERIPSFLRDCAWANEVYTKRFPGICFSLFWCHVAIFLIGSFCPFACWALLTHVLDCCVKSFSFKLLI